MDTLSRHADAGSPVGNGVAAARSSTHSGTAAPLWAITCYFNPIGYRRRLANYHAFRDRLNVPLVAVELSYGGAFHLHEGDADLLIQLRGRHVLWQKERLLNVALAAVPAVCDKVAWLDCDVVFERADWAERASHLLGRYALLHLFREAYEVRQEALPEPNAVLRETAVKDARWPKRSAVCGLATGEMPPEVLSRNAPLEGWSSGLAWAARREVLDVDGFYDSCVLGSGDRVMACAALNFPSHARTYLQMNPRWTEHYLAWAEPYFGNVGDRVGCLDERIRHLWHGSLHDRQYLERHRILHEFDFDPARDIALEENGCWRWNTPKEEMHHAVRRYFESRNEDGRAEECSSPEPARLAAYDG